MSPTEYYKQPEIHAIRAATKPINRKKSLMRSLIYFGIFALLFAIINLIPEIYRDTYSFFLIFFFWLGVFIFQFRAMSLIYSKLPIQFQNDFQELIVEEKEPVKIKEAERITFLYLGDVEGHRFFRRSLVRRISTDAAHNRFFVDHLKINHDEIFFQINSKEDKVNYFNFIYQMHYFNPLTKLIVGRDEVPLPVDPNQVFLVNENRQLLK